MNGIRSVLLSREAGLLALLVLICLTFGSIDDNFRDPYNFLDRTRHWVEIGIIAIPMTFIIATGGIDLSVGSLLALCGIVSGLCFQSFGWPVPLAFGVGMLVGIAGGVFNGLMSSRLRLPPLVTTLATMAMYRGLAMGLSQADPIRNWPESFTDWAGMGAFGWGDWQIPWQTIILLLLAAAGAIIFRHAPVGRWSVQIGENARAAKFSTVPINRVYVLIYAAAGLACGLASVFYTGRFATAHPAAATGLELEVIACVVIGGTRITGGNGSVIGTFIGVLIIGCLRFGLELQGVKQENQIILIGILVVLTAVFNEWMARRQSERTTRHKKKS